MPPPLPSVQDQLHIFLCFFLFLNLIQLEPVLCRLCCSHKGSVPFLCLLWIFWMIRSFISNRLLIDYYVLYRGEDWILNRQAHVFYNPVQSNIHLSTHSVIHLPPLGIFSRKGIRKGVFCSSSSTQTHTCTMCKQTVFDGSVKAIILLFGTSLTSLHLPQLSSFTMTHSYISLLQPNPHTWCLSLVFPVTKVEQKEKRVTCAVSHTS